MGTATFSTEAFDGKIEYRFANENHNKNTVTVISDVFLKRINGDKDVIGGKAYIQLHYDNGYSNLIYGDYLGIPDDGNYHKVGTSIRTSIQDERKNVIATIKGFNSSHKDFNFTKEVSLTIPASPEETKIPSTFTLGRSSAYLGDDITITINISKNASLHKIRFSWGGITQSYQYFYNAKGDALQNDSSDSFSGKASLLLGNTRDLTLRLPKELANNLTSRESDTCVIELITYTDAFLINKVKSVQRRELKISVPPEYTPVISSTSVTTLNSNETVNGWGVTLQRYSKAKAEMSATNSISGDMAAVKCSVSCSNSSKDKSDSASLTTSVFESHGTKTFTFTATDSRGRTAVKTDTLDVLSYDDPAVLIKEVKRVNVETDNTVNETEDGAYLYLILSPQYSQYKDENGSDLNSFSLTAQYKLTSGNSYTENQSIILQSGNYVLIPIDESYRTDESIRVRVNITDFLDNKGFAEGIAQGKSIFLHICNKGKSIGVNTYNYIQNSIKFGLDVYIGDVLLTDYIKNQFGDYVVKTGSVDGCDIRYNYYTDNDTEPKETIYSDLSYEYTVWNSGKVELWSHYIFSTSKPLMVRKSGERYNYIYLRIPAITELNSLSETNYKILEMSATGDSLAILGKGTETGFNGDFFSFLIQKVNAFTSLTVSLDFHIILTPKQGG